MKACYAKYGFGAATGFTLNREEKGNVDYKYQIEAATAGYGQGITTTAIQHLQALSIISNDGEMIKPYIVDKIMDTDTGKVIFKGERQSLGTVVSSETTDKMKSLMASVINGDSSNSTGYSYYMDGYSLIGKTGTAQIFDYSIGKYMTGSSDNIYSFSGMFPGDDPEIIIYAAIKRPKDTVNYVAPMVKEVEMNITKYLNIQDSSQNREEYKVDSFYNRNVNDIKNKLESNNIRVLVIGNGDKVTRQYPSINSIIYEGDLVVLRTNSFDNKMIDLTGYSRKEVINICNLLGISYELEGAGYVYEQSIAVGESITDKVIIKLKNKY